MLATGETWKIKECISCQDSNVVYSITCKQKAGRCKDAPQYVGMVGDTRPCRDRCTEHRGAVNNNRDTGVGGVPNILEHFSWTFDHLKLFKSFGRKDGVQKPNTFSEADNIKFHAVLSHFAKCCDLLVKVLRGCPK